MASEATTHALLLTGFAGSGKDAMYGGLPKHYRRYALADILKEFAAFLAAGMWDAAEILPLFYDREKKEKPFVTHSGIDTLAGKPLTPRWFAQWLGTEACRTYLGDDIWINGLINKIKKDGLPSHIVITDMRFENEAALLPRLLEELGYSTQTVRIVDPAALTSDVSSLHASERAIPSLPVDEEFINYRLEGEDSLATMQAKFRASYAM